MQTAEQEKALREQGGKGGASELGAGSSAEVEELRELYAPNGRYMLVLVLVLFFFFFLFFIFSFFFVGIVRIIYACLILFHFGEFLFSFVYACVH